MKTLGRIFILSFVFVLLSGLMIVAVNASGMNDPEFGRDRAGQTEFRPPLGDDEDGGPFRPEGEEGDFGGARWIFGLVKNVGVIAILVAVIVWPKGILKRKRRLSG